MSIATYIGTRRTPTGTYEDYASNDAEAAKGFLKSKKVDKNQYYIRVETPEGTWGIDIDGLYLESLLPFQSDIQSATCEGRAFGMLTLIGLRFAANGITDNFVAHVECGQCKKQWVDGLRYQNITAVRCPECMCLNRVNSSNIQVHNI